MRGAHARRAAQLLALGLLSSFGSLLQAPDASWADEKKKRKTKGDDLGETDSLTIAQMLFSDGLYDRASAVLDEVDPTAEEIDAIQFWRLRAFVHRQLGRHAEAAEAFQKAIDAGDVEPQIFLSLAEAHRKSENYDEAVQVLERGPPTLKALPETYLVHASALHRLDRKPGAYLVIDEGFLRFPDDIRIERQRVLLLVDMQLYVAAIDAAKAFLDRGEATDDDWVVLAEALRKGGQVDRATLILEEANLRFPGNEDIRKLLARTYLDQGRTVTAAEVLRPIAWLDPETAIYTAELYRRATRYQRAIRLNERIVDQKEKFRQRLSILLEQEDYELAAGLFPRLARLGLLSDDSIAYAMAYAFFQIRDFERAERLLLQIKDADLFRQSLQIRKAIEQCQESLYACE